jgi:endogenous inhibitor of DNA gyrase (YacG/DUF329 family)
MNNLQAKISCPNCGGHYFKKTGTIHRTYKCARCRYIVNLETVADLKEHTPVKCKGCGRVVDIPNAIEIFQCQKCKPGSPSRETKILDLARCEVCEKFFYPEPQEVAGIAYRKSKCPDCFVGVYLGDFKNE